MAPKKKGKGKKGAKKAKKVSLDLMGTVLYFYL